jgi:hypothetical protein
MGLLYNIIQTSHRVDNPTVQKGGVFYSSTPSITINKNVKDTSIPAKLQNKQSPNSQYPHKGPLTTSSAVLSSVVPFVC